MRKNKSWLCFLLELAGFWIVLIILIMVVKYCYLGLIIKNYDLARISLNNILTLGAAISAAAFAWRQIEINQHTAEVELAIRYKDHYVKLVKALRNFISCYKLSESTSSEIRESAWIELIDITLEGQLVFNSDIQRLNEEIQSHANGVFQNNEKINAKKISLQDMHQAHEEYWFAYRMLIGDGNKKSMCDQATELYKKNTAILING